MVTLTLVLTLTLGVVGVAEDESDLSCMSYSLGDVPIDAGNVRRNCRHRPNSTLNGLLTLLTVITLFMAVGIGIGHYIGKTINMKQKSIKLMLLKSRGCSWAREQCFSVATTCECKQFKLIRLQQVEF